MSKIQLRFWQVLGAGLPDDSVISGGWWVRALYIF